MDIFTLTDDEGRLFHPVRQAATFAKYSRSPDSAHELVKQTDELAAAKFQQKWIVNFGHNAIAELATIPVAFEGVSIVASKAIEAWERPGVCEKSTRMQHFDRDSLYVPEGIEPATLDRVMPLVEKCFQLYESLLKDLPAVLGEKNPDASQAQLNRAVFDIARYLLPAGCRTNLGICAYPRDLSEMISVLSGNPNRSSRPSVRTSRRRRKPLVAPSSVTLSLICGLERCHYPRFARTLVWLGTITSCFQRARTSMRPSSGPF